MNRVHLVCLFITFLNVLNPALNNFLLRQLNKSSSKWVMVVDKAVLKVINGKSGKNLRYKYNNLFNRHENRLNRFKSQVESI